MDPLCVKHSLEDYNTRIYSILRSIDKSNKYDVMIMSVNNVKIADMHTINRPKVTKYRATPISNFNCNVINTMSSTNKPITKLTLLLGVAHIYIYN